MPRHAALLCLAPLLLAGCAAIERNEISHKEDTLAAAGFVVRPADTADRVASLNTLPPNKFYRRVEGSHVSYLYPDPVYCHCLYVGGQTAYGRYQQFALQQRIANDQVTAAELNADSGWGWGPWGGYGPGYF